MAKSITVKDLLSNTHLRVVTGEEYLQHIIKTEDISRPGF